MKPLIWSLIVLSISLSSLVISGCVSQKNTSEIDQKHCESDRSFVFVPAGKFIIGSDKAERDYLIGRKPGECHSPLPKFVLTALATAILITYH